jgi:hypothetical protein
MRHVSFTAPLKPFNDGPTRKQPLCLTARKHAVGAVVSRMRMRGDGGHIVFEASTPNLFGGGAETSRGRYPDASIDIDSGGSWLACAGSIRPRNRRAGRSSRGGTCADECARWRPYQRVRRLVAGAVWMLQRYAKRFLSRASAWGALLPRASADASLIAIRPVRLAFA